MLLRSLSALALCAALATPAFANGVISEFRAGGVEFKQSADIAIAREDLYLSIREVRVHYDYRSDATAAQTVTIGFPMPLVPVDGGPSHMGGATLAEGTDPTNYMQFEAKVNGTPVEVIAHHYAWFAGQNITAELEALGVSLIVDDFEAMRAQFDAVDKAKLAELAERGVVILYEGAVDVADWEYQTVYEWQQTFEPGITKVDISYAPLYGTPSDIGGMYEGGREYDDPDAVAENDAQYCIDQGVKSAIAKRREAGDGYEIVTLGYVVKTGNFWKGPIEEFNLTVDKADPAPEMENLDLVAFCPSEAKKISDTQFFWSAKDYEPTRDIDVVYYNFYYIG